MDIKKNMRTVADLLGVEMGKPFKVKLGGDIIGCTYWLKDDGLYADVYGYKSSKYVKKSAPEKNGVILGELLTTDCEVIPMPFIPTKGETYHAVEVNGSIVETIYAGTLYDMGMVNMGNAFCTFDEAVAHREEMLARFKEIAGNDGKKY